jgi:hypothetical protein
MDRLKIIDITHTNGQAWYLVSCDLEIVRCIKNQAAENSYYYLRPINTTKSLINVTESLYTFLRLKY